MVRGGRVVGEGFHARAGGPHAEIEALRAAGARARGADALRHARAVHAPRADAALHRRACSASGFARVVIGVVDPEPARARPRHPRGCAGAAFASIVGVGEAEARRADRGVPLARAPRAAVRHAEAGGHARRPHRGRAAATRAGSRAPRRAGSCTRCATSPTPSWSARGPSAPTIRALTCRVRGGHDPLRVVLAGRGLASAAARSRPGAAAARPTLVVAPRGARAAAGGGACADAGVDVALAAGPARPRAVRARHAGARRSAASPACWSRAAATVAAEALRAGVVDRAAPVRRADVARWRRRAGRRARSGSRARPTPIRLTRVTVRAIGDGSPGRRATAAAPTPFASARVARYRTADDGPGSARVSSQTVSAPADWSCCSTTPSIRPRRSWSCGGARDPGGRQLHGDPRPRARVPRR